VAPPRRLTQVTTPTTTTWGGLEAATARSHTRLGPDEDSSSSRRDAGEPWNRVGARQIPLVGDAGLAAGQAAVLATLGPTAGPMQECKIGRMPYRSGVHPAIRLYWCWHDACRRAPRSGTLVQRQRSSRRRGGEWSGGASPGTCRSTAHGQTHADDVGVWSVWSVWSVSPVGVYAWPRCRHSPSPLTQRYPPEPLAASGRQHRDARITDMHGNHPVCAMLPSSPGRDLAFRVHRQYGVDARLALLTSQSINTKPLIGHVPVQMSELLPLIVRGRPGLLVVAASRPRPPPPPLSQASHSPVIRTT